MSNHTSNIKLIVAACLKQNPAAERKLFEIYYGYVVSICNRYGHDRQEVEEMVNDTFFTVFRYLDRFDDAYEFKPWLRKVCVNSCLQYLKKYKTEFKHYTLEDYNAEMIEDSMDDILGEQYLAMIKQLPPAYKVVFNLYVFEEYKHHEIAELLGISVGTSKSNLSRAKAKISSMITAYRNSNNDKAYG